MYVCACVCVYTRMCASFKMFDVIVYRIGLLQFALTYCPVGEIKKILQILRTTETEDLY